MADIIQSPVKGRHLHAQWGADVAEMLNRHERTLAAGEAVPWINRRGRNGRLEPFTVRYDEDLSTWLVYLPPSSVTMVGAAVHLQPAGAGQADWYKVEGAAALANQAGAYVITAHVKERVKVGSETSAHAVVYVTASAGHVSGSNDTAGDVWSCDVANVQVTRRTDENDDPVSDEGGNPVYDRQTIQVYRGTATVAAHTPGVLELYWATPAVSSSPSVWTPHVEASAEAPICGGSLEDTTLPETGSATAWYSIDCSGATPDPSVATSNGSSATTISVPVYDFLNGVLTHDRRSNLSSAVFYP